MRKVLIVYNPKSGRGHFANYIDGIISICHECGFIPVFFRVGTGVELISLGDSLDTYDVLLVAGGDGTLNGWGRRVTTLKDWKEFGK